ncbi:unnamed protein product, partial [Polarella glacialis]
MQVLLCGIFFDEFGEFTHLQTLVFLSGLGLILAGLVATSMAPQVEAEKSALPQFPQHTGRQESLDTPADELLPGDLPVFVPPTALLKRIPEDRPIAIISSGLLERSSSSLFSSDLFLVGEIQRSAMCFGGRYQLGKAVPNK